jgi:RNA polymerase sigma factor (sigma-70 family)
LQAIIDFRFVRDLARAVHRMSREAGAGDGGAALRLSEGAALPPDDHVMTPKGSSLEILYRTQAPRLLRLFGRRAGRQDADDLVQDSFVRLADAGRDQSVHKPEAYLSRVAGNLLRNRARAAFHRSIVQNDVGDHPAAGATEMTAMLEARDMLNRLQAAMEKLNPKTRDIFMAHRIDGASYAEIAERMELSVKGVEWHMTKAIAHLHRAAGPR